MNTLFLHEAWTFHNLSTHNPQSYPLSHPQPYPQAKIKPLRFALLHESRG